MAKKVNRWIHQNVDRTLTDKIDRYLKTAKDEYGRAKYPSRSKFIDAAIVEKLREEEVAV